MTHTTAAPDQATDSEGSWFAEESDEAVLRPESAELVAVSWKLLIVDDDEQVHAVTRMVLADMTIQNRTPLFLSALSGGEARAILSEHGDIAVILLDVVMETDDAGLLLVRYIREELNNRRVQIILRTGQPGQAPERHVIDHYEINDYKAKSELTADKLYTATAAALRAYRTIDALETSRRGLEKIIRASATLFEQKSLTEFISGVILQLRSMIRGTRDIILCIRAQGESAVQVVAGSGNFTVEAGRDLQDYLPAALCDQVLQVFRERVSLFCDDHCVIVFPTHAHVTPVVFLTVDTALSAIDRQLLGVFCDKVAIGFDNVYLHEQLLAAQRATVYALGKLAEYKDEVTGDHVRRIGSLAKRVSQRLKDTGVYLQEISDDFIEQIELASVLHDVGKVAIADAILKKPGALDPEQRAIMQSHAAIGGQLLREAAALVDRPTYLSMGAEIAGSHHERFDGTGYPQCLAGQAIPLSGRIVALADIYDALIHERQYKPAWPKEKAIALIEHEAERHFDPEIVKAFFHVIGHSVGTPS
ncbi:MAG: DUF3369 domain-containing protein [Rhodospirillaceae bacterium]